MVATLDTLRKRRRLDFAPRQLQLETPPPVRQMVEPTAFAGLELLANLAGEMSVPSSFSNLLNTILQIASATLNLSAGWVVSVTSQGPEILAFNAPIGVMLRRSNLHQTETIPSAGFPITLPLYEDANRKLMLHMDAIPGDSMNVAHAEARTKVAILLGHLARLALQNCSLQIAGLSEQNAKAEIDAGAAAQRWLFPPNTADVSTFRYVGESRPGQRMGGDLLEVIPLGPRELFVAVGDVTGKGVAASVLQTAVQSYLRASLGSHRDLLRAITELNTFVLPRRPADRFVTLWGGVLSRETNTLTYIDAGHGYGLLVRGDGSLERLDNGGGPPIGALENFPFETVTVPLTPGDRLLVVSDGIVEQHCDLPADDLEFGLRGVTRATRGATASPELVSNLFSAVEAHAGGRPLSDDATTLIVEW